MRWLMKENVSANGTSQGGRIKESEDLIPLQSSFNPLSVKETGQEIFGTGVPVPYGKD